MVQSVPLLKFRDEAAVLAPEGLEILRGLQGLICPVIFMGDGRGGKSYLASRVLDAEEAFLSSDTAEPVTEGIDVVAAPVRALLDGCEGSFAQGEEGSEAAPEGEHILVLDCEGGNNAMAAIRTIVNVFGILLGTEVVFVANGMASEQALQNLGAALAARSLIRLDGDSELPEQQLIFVVNKNTLRYEDTALEKILDQKQTDPARAELREAVRTAFPERQFFAVPLMGMPDFEKNVQDLRGRILKGRKALQLSGTAVGGEQLCGLLELIVEEVKKTNEVSFPSMNRFVIFDGFLAPAANRLAMEMQSALPKLDDYDPELTLRDPRKGMIDQFEKMVKHIRHKNLVDEATNNLKDRIDSMWLEVVQTNEMFGEQVLEIKTEKRETVEERTKAIFGGRGLLKHLLVIRKTMSVESRAVVYKKRGGQPEYSPWAKNGNHVTRFEQSALDTVGELPVIKGKLWKRSPNVLRAVLQIVGGRNQQRTCLVKDGHFLWWDHGQPEAKGCINFLVHRAEVIADKAYPTHFFIRPADEQGWLDKGEAFTGGENREFSFDAEDSEVTRDEWVDAIAKHIQFGNKACQQLGLEKVMKEVGVKKPTLDQV